MPASRVLSDSCHYVVESQTMTGWFVLSGPLAEWDEACRVLTSLERARTGRPHRIVRVRTVREVPIQPIVVEVEQANWSADAMGESRPTRESALPRHDSTVLRDMQDRHAEARQQAGI